LIDLLVTLGDLLWGPWTFFVLLGTGVLYTITTRFMQWRALTHGVQVLRGVYDDPKDPGAISHFQALSAALSGTVGLGNIGGVALAIGIGGPGALFWMWVVALLGMAIKSVEVTLALMFRNTEDPKKPSGGAMWVIDKTLGTRGPVAKTVARVLGSVFCFTLIISTITGGNIFQSWNVAELTQTYFSVPQMTTSVVLAVIVGAVIIGGIRRIGSVAGALVPFMVLVYVLASLVVIAKFIDLVPSMLLLVVQSALSPTEAGGAFLGAGAYYGFTIGLKRALFSNEAGQGSAPIAHSAARTDEPAREGALAGLEPFIDTIVICTLTALVILVTGTWNRDALGAIDGPVSLVPSETAEMMWSVDAPGDVSSLPARRAPEVWSEGDTVYLIGHVLGEDGAPVEHAQRSSERIQIVGTVTRRSGPSGDASELEVSWAPVQLRASDWSGAPRQIQVPNRDIYRSYEAAALTALAFDRAFPGLGMWLVTFACWLFAISTMISWAYYGEQGIVYLFGERFVIPYKALFLVATAAAPIAATNADALLAIIDFGTGAMLWGNIPILLLMGHLAVRNLRTYFQRLDDGEFEHRK